MEVCVLAVRSVIFQFVPLENKVKEEEEKRLKELKELEIEKEAKKLNELVKGPKEAEVQAAQ